MTPGQEIRYLDGVHWRRGWLHKVGQRRHHVRSTPAPGEAGSYSWSMWASDVRLPTPEELAEEIRRERRYRLASALQALAHELGAIGADVSAERLDQLEAWLAGVPR